MPNQVLAEIVAVEQEIQARLAEERRKAAAWLAAERDRSTREIEEKLAAAQREFRQSVALAQVEADSEVTALLQGAEIRAARLRSLPDQLLREKVALHLEHLLPEAEK